MKVTGKVIDESNDAPLPGASILVVNKDNSLTGYGVTAGNNGTFAINSELLNDPYKKLQFSYVGYQPIIVRPAASMGDVPMTREGKELATITIVGYIVRKKRLGLLVAVIIILTIAGIIISKSKIK